MGKIKENRGLINKKDVENQFIAFFSINFSVFSFGALSLFSLSYSCTLRKFLEHWRKDEKGRS